MTYWNALLIRALTATGDKIYVCRNPYTQRWVTIQHQLTIADTKEHQQALAVARAQAFKLPRARDTNRKSSDVVVEAVGRFGRASSGYARSGVGLG
ncbi:hypothetical protein [Glutamicibacter sp.]|uniref:hypothetical protein n=1 Tax=Glutamicibacter sp. TaxID=1931995 RepID=UPI0028BF529A|nr:hypothetical protein [Glutamicibacter sp.]